MYDFRSARRKLFIYAHNLLCHYSMYCLLNREWLKKCPPALCCLQIPPTHPTVHQTNVTQYAFVYHKSAHHLLQNGAFWDIGLMHCEICARGLYPAYWWHEDESGKVAVELRINYGKFVIFIPGFPMLKNYILMPKGHMPSLRVWIRQPQYRFIVNFKYTMTCNFGTFSTQQRTTISVARDCF